jgi:hypothetical protein
MYLLQISKICCKINTYIINNALNKSQAIWELVLKKHGKIKCKEAIKKLNIEVKTLQILKILLIVLVIIMKFV